MNRFYVTASHPYDNFTEEHASLDSALSWVKNNRNGTINDVIEWNAERTKIVGFHGTWKNGVRYESLSDAIAEATK